MKKLFLTLVLAVGFVGAATAQNVTVGAGYGSAKLKYIDGDYTELSDSAESIALSVGFVGDIQDGGIIPEGGLSYAFSTDSDAPSGGSIGINAGGRYYLGDSFFGRAGLGLGFATGDSKEIIEAVGLKSTTVNAGVGVGYSVGAFDITANYGFSLGNQIKDPWDGEKIRSRGFSLGVVARL